MQFIVKKGCVGFLKVDLFSFSDLTLFSVYLWFILDLKRDSNKHNCAAYIGLFQKIKTGDWEGILYWKKPSWNFWICHFTLRNSGEKNFHPHKFCKIVWHSFLEIARSKTKAHHGNSTWFLFLNTPGNSTSFLIDPWNFQMLFLQHPWKFHVLNPPV